MATEIYTMSNPNMMAAMGRLDSADLAERLGLDKNADKTTFLNELHTRFDAGQLDDQPTLKLMATLIDKGLMMDYVNGQIVKVEWPKPETITDPFEQSDAIAASILSLIDANSNVDPDDEDNDDDYDDYDEDDEDGDTDDSPEYSPSYYNPYGNDNTVNTDNTDSTDNTNNTDSARSTEPNADGAPNIRVRIHASGTTDELDPNVKAVIDLIDKMMTSR